MAIEDFKAARESTIREGGAQRAGSRGPKGPRSLEGKRNFSEKLSPNVHSAEYETPREVGPGNLLYEKEGPGPSFIYFLTVTVSEC